MSLHWDDIKLWWKQSLIRIGMWFLKHGGGRVSNAPLVPDELLKDALTLIQYQNTQWPDRDSEAKRAQVYWQLQNAHPLVSKKLISVAIEEALCGLS